VLGSGIAGIDATVVNIALPGIGRDLNVGFATLQWTVTAYTLTLASLILLGGASSWSESRGSQRPRCCAGSPRMPAG
jgi:MFS family permease